MANPPWLLPDWPAPASIHARITTRQTPGISLPPRENCNLGNRCGDDAAAVAHNRASLIDLLQLPATPMWLHQVHGSAVVDADGGVSTSEPEADAAISRRSGVVLAVLTADCLPVLFCTAGAGKVAIAHAGWRGLAGGVLEATVAALDDDPARVLAWLGPAIGAASYEIGEEVRQAFIDADADAASAFTATRHGHWLCDLDSLARRRLAAVGVTRVSGGGFDTRLDPRFYSFRGDPRCGRFASLIWRDEAGIRDSGLEIR